jgi:hypothetical protein
LCPAWLTDSLRQSKEPELRSEPGTGLQALLNTRELYRLGWSSVLHSAQPGRVTHKLQLLACGSSRAFCILVLSRVSTATYTVYFVWIHGCTKMVGRLSVASRLGGTVTVVYSQTESPRKLSQISLLPLLVVLFILSYAILTLLVVEQGRTIESQRSLLREMLKDSSQLAALKGKLAQEEVKRSQARGTTELDQKEPGSGNPDSAPKRNAKRQGKSARSHKEVPQRPTSDLEDVRRATRVI